MPTALSPAALTLWWAVVGLFVGSFLNVVIHRYGIEGESVTRPRRSRCPSCRTTLTWKENVPVVSWLLLRGRCRTCGWRISLRYPLVELANGGLYVLAVQAAGADRIALWLVYSVVLSALLVATVVDFACFEIPDSVSIGGMVAAPLACLGVPALHEHTALARALAGEQGVDGIAALAGGLAGMAVGGGMLWLIGWVGAKAYGTDAMGFGDVKLLAAGGGFVGPGGALAALMVAAGVASLFGVGNMARFLWVSRARAAARGRRDAWGRSIRVARIAGRYLPFGPFLALGIGIVLLHWEHVIALWP